MTRTPSAARESSSQACRRRSSSMILKPSQTCQTICKFRIYWYYCSVADLLLFRQIYVGVYVIINPLYWHLFERLALGLCITFVNSEDTLHQLPKGNAQLPHRTTEDSQEMEEEALIPRLDQGWDASAGLHTCGGGRGEVGEAHATQGDGWHQHSWRGSVLGLPSDVNLCSIVYRRLLVHPSHVLCLLILVWQWHCTRN